VSGHLLEEVLLLGNAKYTSLQPILNVASPDVQASHGAKVQRIPLEKLFYMQSRGLHTDLALKMIINAYVEQILGHFEVDEEEKKQIYSFIK
jgi:Fe-S cluster assembly protein SufD